MAYIQNKDIVQREIASETILVPIQGDLVTDQKVFTLNTVGKFIWEQLEIPTEAAELARRVVAHFNVDLKQAEQDVHDFLRQMQEKHLIHVES